MARSSAAPLLLALVASAALVAIAQAADTTAVPRPTTDTEGRGYRGGKGGKGGYKGGHKGGKPSHDYKHDYKPCAGAEIDSYTGEVTSQQCGGKYNSCCEGWLCKTDKKLSVKYPYEKDYCEIHQPSSTLLGDFKPYLTKNEPEDGSCCIAGSLFYDITELVCVDGFCDPYATYGNGEIKVKDLGFGGFEYSEESDALKARNEISCLCCSGKSIILPDYDYNGAGTGGRTTDTTLWDDIETGMSTNGNMDFGLLETAAKQLVEEGSDARTGSYTYKDFKVYCHELPLTPYYTYGIPYLDKVLGACPTGYSGAPYSGSPVSNGAP